MQDNSPPEASESLPIHILYNNTPTNQQLRDDDYFINVYFCHDNAQNHGGQNPINTTNQHYKILIIPIYHKL